MNGKLRALVVLCVIVFFADVQSREYVVGVSLPLSGEHKENAQKVLNALELFVQQFNIKGGVSGDTLKLRVVDDQGVIPVAQERAKELVKDAQVVAVVGYLDNDVARACAPLYKDAQIPLFSPAITDPVIMLDNPWIFSGTYSDFIQTIRIASYIKGTTSAANVLIVRTNSLDSQRHAQALTQGASNVGLTVKALEYTGAPKDLPKKIAELEPFKPQAIALFAEPQASEAIVVALRDAGIHLPVYGPDHIIDVLKDKSEEKYVENIYASFPFTFDILSQEGHDFVTAYRKKFKQYPTMYAAFAYDGLSLIARGLEKGSSRKDIQAYLKTLNDSAVAPLGATGPLYFSENGFAYRTSIMRTYYKGMFKPAFEQLRLVNDVSTLKLLKHNPKAVEGVIEIGGAYYYKISVVFVGIDINRIDNIDTKTTTADTDFFVWYKWRGAIDPQDFVFLNSVGDLKITDWKGNYTPPTKDESKKTPGTVDEGKIEVHFQDHWMSYRVKGVFLQPFLFTHFPLDTQPISILLAHKNKNADAVILVADQTMVNESALADIYPQEWDYTQRKDTSTYSRYRSTFGDPDYKEVDNQYSVYQFTMEVRRKFLPYILTIFIPLLVILLVNMCVFLIVSTDVNTRVNAVVVALLAVLLYHAGVLDKLPRIGYLTNIDLVFLALYMIELLLFFEVCFVGQLTNETLIRRIERTSVMLFSLILLIGFGFLFYAIRSTIHSVLA